MLICDLTMSRTSVWYAIANREKSNNIQQKYIIPKNMTRMAKAAEIHIFCAIFLIFLKFIFFETFFFIYFGKNEKFRHSFDIEKKYQNNKKKKK